LVDIRENCLSIIKRIEIDVHHFSSLVLAGFSNLFLEEFDHSKFNALVKTIDGDCLIYPISENICLRFDLGVLLFNLFFNFLHIFGDMIDVIDSLLCTVARNIAKYLLNFAKLVLQLENLRLKFLVFFLELFFGFNK